MSHSGRYKKMLSDARWDRRRMEILRRDGYRCTNCGASGHLNVHHRWYIYGRKPWQYPDRCLVTLCEKCHHHVHFVRQVFSVLWIVVLVALAYILSRTIR